MDGSLQALSSKAAYLPVVAYFDDKLKAMEADLISLNSRSIAKIKSKLDSLESRFPDLACIGSKLSALETKISDLDGYRTEERGTEERRTEERRTEER